MLVSQSLIALEQNVQPIDLNILANFPCSNRLTYVVSEFMSCNQASNFIKSLSDLSFACVTRENTCGKDFMLVSENSNLTLAFAEDSKPKVMFNSFIQGLHLWSNYAKWSEVESKSCNYTPKAYIERIAPLSYKILVDANKLIGSCIEEEHWDPEFNGALKQKIQPLEHYLEEQLSDKEADSLHQKWFKKCSIVGSAQATLEATRPGALRPNKTASSSSHLLASYNLMRRSL